MVINCLYHQGVGVDQVASRWLGGRGRLSRWMCKVRRPGDIVMES